MAGRVIRRIVGMQKIRNHWTNRREMIGSRAMRHAFHSTHSWLLKRRADGPEKKSKLNS
jgi:hypothetical protein